MSLERVTLHTLSLVSLFLLTACPAPKPKKTNNATFIKVIMGDPRKLIEGAELTQEIPGDFFDNIESLQLDSVYSFDEKRPYQNTTTRNLEQENSAPENKSADAEPEIDAILYKFSVIKKSSDEITIRSPGLNVELNLTKNNLGHFTITSSRADNIKFDTKLLHFSATPDKRFISLLIFDDHDPETGKSVSALYFTNEVKASPPEILSEEYSFTKGIGVRYRWPKNNEQNINLCGDTPEQFKQEARVNAQRWNFALNKEFSINITTPERSLPFSDLNQRCITVINGYLADPDPNVAGYGLTVTVADDEKHEFIDSDIFFMIKEFEKNKQPMMADSYLKDRNFTMLHEMGHFLGLHHHFTEGVDSIMSYNFKLAPKLYDYDIRAIKALYAN